MLTQYDKLTASLITCSYRILNQQNLQSNEVSKTVFTVSPYKVTGICYFWLCNFTLELVSRRPIKVGWWQFICQDFNLGANTSDRREVMGQNNDINVNISYSVDLGLMIHFNLIEDDWGKPTRDLF